MQERRRYIRYNGKGSLVLRPESGLKAPVKAELVDINFTGLGIFAEKNIDIDTMVYFELKTRSWAEPVAGKGKVVYSREVKKDGHNSFRIGIEFTDMDKKTTQSLINTIRNNPRSSGKKGL